MSSIHFIMMKNIIFLIFLLTLSFSNADKTDFEKNFDNKVLNLAVHSEYDLTGQFAKLQNTVIFVNKMSTVLTKYIYVVNNSKLYHIEFISDSGKKLNFQKHETNMSTLHYYEISLEDGVLPNGSYVLQCKIIYGDKITPAVKFRSMDEDQLMKFEENLLFLSPYLTEHLKVTYLIIPNSLIEVTEIPKDLSDNQILYEFYNITAYSDKIYIKIIFINNNPFLVIKSLQKTIDVNHFGKITVRDEVVLENNGPKLKGPYTPNIIGNPSKATTNFLYTHLPASAENIKFFDILGNSSKTTIYDYDNFKTLKFKTRYPLLGGWKTSYILQYQLPIYEYLWMFENRFWLKIRSIDYVVEGQYIEEVVVRIVLPEGAIANKINIPQSLNLKNEETTCYSGLCVMGRQTIVLSGSDLFDIYAEVAMVEYFFNSLYLLRAPLVVGFYFQSAFLVVLCVNRFII